MNDEVKDYIETINNKKVRTQYNSVENDQSAETEYPCTSTRPTQHNLQLEAMSPCTMMNGPAINNLNNHSSSNGYNNVQRQENIDNFKPQNGRGDKDSDTARKNSLYRNIYHTSSSDDDDDDEHCVYTYKGAEVGSDLPESFFHLGVNVQNSRDRASRCSSPEMDFLEMDFDPGPSNGQDSDSDNASLLQNFSSNEHINEMYTDHREFAKIDMVETDNSYSAGCDENANCYSNKMLMNTEAVPTCLESNSLKSFLQKPSVDYEQPCCSKSLYSNECDVDSAKYTIQPCRRIPDQDLSASSSDEERPDDDQSQIYINLRIRKNSLDSDREAVTFIPNGFNHGDSGNEQDSSCDVSFIDATGEDDLISYEDLLPLDPSYSISAIFNVMKVLRTSHSDESDREKLTNLLRPKQIPENVPLVEYLFMRAVQNANEIDLAHFAASVVHNQLHSRFFVTYPQTRFNLFQWLNCWMRKGAIPVVTRNIQERGTLAAKNIIQNPWRHNVVYKLEAPYVHLSNPLERILDRLLQSQLSQPPLIYVKRQYVLEKWHSKVDLRSLTRANHNRWYNENVLGQVATIIREDNSGSQTTQYVRVPSNCRCGITLFVPSENVGLCKELDEALELAVSCY